MVPAIDAATTLRRPVGVDVPDDPAGGLVPCVELSTAIGDYLLVVMARVGGRHRDAAILTAHSGSGQSSIPHSRCAFVHMPARYAMRSAVCSRSLFGRSRCVAMAVPAAPHTTAMATISASVKVSDSTSQPNTAAITGPKLVMKIGRASCRERV